MIWILHSDPVFKISWLALNNLIIFVAKSMIMTGKGIVFDLNLNYWKPALIFIVYVHFCIYRMARIINWRTHKNSIRPIFYAIYSLASFYVTCHWDYQLWTCWLTCRSKAVFSYRKKGLKVCAMKSICIILEFRTL